MSETKRSLVTLITGAHFRPPAKALLHSSPKGLPLLLQPEWDNPYDANAIKVLLRIKDVPVVFHDLLRAALEGYGFELEELMAQEEPIHLGYVASSSGKPLARSNYTDGNAEFAAALGEDGEQWSLKPGLATLDYGLAGEPLVRLELPALYGLPKVEDEG